MAMASPGHYVMGSRQAGGDDMEIEAAHGIVRVSAEEDCWPCCIVWTWIPGCTQCTVGIVGHMGIGTSAGGLWEFMGDGASQGAQGQGLAFGPVLRYLRLDPRRVRRGTWDEGIETTIKKWRGRMHGACVSNCHSFVADCLHEMRYAGIPCWTWLPYLLAVWIWVLGRFASFSRFVYCFLPVAGIAGVVAAITVFGNHAA
mmetsp:Transcript_105453/g.308311  ORF Transcript_105453/g.308311 Transcript_105453/m.308311 type:complete len:200 (+) Transcript_105453:47-646(+)